MRPARRFAISGTGLGDGIDCGHDTVQVPDQSSISAQAMTASFINRTILFFAAITLGASAVRANEDSDAITQATMRYVFQKAEVDDPSVTIEKIVPGFARVKVISISGKTDPAIAFLKGGNSKWKVLSLGTGFTRKDLAEMGIPASLAP